MSAKKGFETKLREDTDSGFLSGELSGPCESGELDYEAIDCDKKKSDEVGDESGVTNIPNQLVDVTICESTPNYPQRQSDLPPIKVLFQQDEDGDTQLHIASVHGCEKSVSTLIRVCPEKSWLDVPNDYGHTPLHLAVMSGNAVVAKMLLIAGASLAVRDYTGETPLHKATAARHLECLKALLAHQPRKLSSVLDQRNYNGQCCVHIAASAGSIETLQTLVYYGADINAREHLAGWTALHIGARRGDSKLVQYLRERCPGVMVHARDNGGRTARRLARHTKAEKAFAASKDDSETESDSDDDGYDSESESLFERLRDSLSAASINVA